MKGKWIKKFIKDAVPKIIEGLGSAKIIIFDSRIKGNAKDESDIDVIIISHYFKNIPFLKRMPKLLKLVRFDKHIDFLCYTEEEFEKVKRSSVVVSYALKEAIWIDTSQILPVKLKERKNEES